MYNLHPQKKLVKETSKSISKDIERERAHEEPLNKIGSFVALTTSDLEKLESEHGEAKIAEYIQAVNDYCASKGKRYKDYAATIRNWIRRDKEKAQIRGYSNKIDRRTKNLDGSPVETPYDNLF